MPYWRWDEYGNPVACDLAERDEWSTGPGALFGGRVWLDVVGPSEVSTALLPFGSSCPVWETRVTGPHEFRRQYGTKEAACVGHADAVYRLRRHCLGDPPFDGLFASVTPGRFVQAIGRGTPPGAYVEGVAEFDRTILAGVLRRNRLPPAVVEDRRILIGPIPLDANSPKE